METPNYCQSSTSIEVCSPSHLKQASFDGQMDASQIEPTMDVEQLDTNGNSPTKLEADEASRSLEDGARASSADAADDMKSSIGPGSQAQGDAKDGDPCNKAASVDDARSVETDGIETKVSGSANDCDGAVASRTKEHGISRTKSSSHEHGLGNVNDSETYLSRIEDVRIDEVEEHSSAQSSGHHSDVYEFAKAESGIKDYDAREKSNAELDYDMVDPLEVARQVAIEVEREVGDRREQSCSSSDKAPQSGNQHPDSPDSSHETESRAQKESSEEVPLRLDLSAEDRATSPESLDTEEPKKGTLECSQLTEVVQGLPADTEKTLCNIDLNELVYSEDEDQPENPLSTPISIVSASRASAAPGLPNAPLQFKGSLGWKGSAATSAFRPASPRRIPEVDKVHSTGGSNSSSRQRDIDLNVYDCAYDDQTDDQTLEKQEQVRGSGLPSGESSVEVSTRVSERLELDLNRVTDDSDAPSEWQTERHHQPRNGYVGHSLSSSSSSEQHSLRNIDLNDPSSASESPDHPSVIKLFQNFNNGPGVKKSDDDVISLLGQKVHVKRKDLIPQSHPLLNGRIPDATVDFNLSRSGGFLGIGSTVAYSHSPVFGYNGLTLGPAAVALSSGVSGPGGPIPSYMLDSRGAPVIHQVMGSTSALAPAFSQPPPFMMSIPGSNGGAGPPRSSFDLNSGLFLEGGGNRESGGGGGVGLRQFLNTGQSRPINDQFKSSSSGVGTKRKEPELGWEPYPFRHHPPTWK